MLYQAMPFLNISFVVKKKQVWSKNDVKISLKKFYFTELTMHINLINRTIKMYFAKNSFLDG